MKVIMTSGYGDISAGDAVDFADDAEAKRLIDLKAARLPVTDEKDPQAASDAARDYVKVGKAKAPAAAPSA